MITKRDNFIGWVGALCVVSAYALLTFELLTHGSIGYNVLNLTGGVALCYRVWLDKNYSNVFLEIIFIAVAIYALVKIFM